MKSLLLIIVTIFVLAVETFGHGTNKVVCYYGSWAKYRQGNGNCEEETIDPNLCTHLIYTFVGLNGEDGSVKVLDAWADLPASEPGGGRDGYGKFNALKKINPELKTLIAVGGWNEGETAKYSNVLNDPNLRSNFVKSALELVLKYGFDGFDVDWEYPNQRGSEGKESDKEAFIATLKELHEAFQPHGLLISAAVAAAKTSASKSYIIPEMNSYLDLINLMAYDLHGAWESHTGIVAPLYPRADESGEDREVLNVEACVNYWLENGADPKKLVLGIPLYGRSFQLVDKNNYKPGSPSVVNGQGLQGPYTRTAGTLGYNEILELNQNEWDHYWDDEGKVPYMVRGQDWVGYDNEKSVGLKAQYAIDRGLGGVMVWSVETDDLTGISGQKFVLLNSINSVLHGGSVPTTSSTTIGAPTDPSETTEKPSSPPTDPTKPTETTTDKPSTPPSTDICQHEGFVRDKNDCSVFYECIKEQNGELKPTRFQCGAGTYFNEETLVCDYKENVKCNVLL